MSEIRSEPIGAIAVRDVERDEGRDLLARHRAGDAVAFALLMRQFRAAVYGYFRRNGCAEALADDLFQETFLRVHAHSGQYSAARPFRVWLFTIAHNVLRSHWRKASVRRFLVSWWAGEREPSEVVDPQAWPDEQVATTDCLRWLETALQALPERHRQALVLTQIEGLSMDEAAEVMGAPVATLKTWVHRGRLSLAGARRSHEGETE